MAHVIRVIEGRTMDGREVAVIIDAIGFSEPFEPQAVHDDFGVNLMRLPPGNWSSQRHWHSHEDEFAYVLEGELTLIEDGGQTVLRAGDCAAFPKGSCNGHHMINRSDRVAVNLEVGSRQPADVTTCSDINMMSANADGRFVHKGTPYPEP